MVSVCIFRSGLFLTFRRRKYLYNWVAVLALSPRAFRMGSLFHFPSPPFPFSFSFVYGHPPTGTIAAFLRGGEGAKIFEFWHNAKWYASKRHDIQRHDGKRRLVLVNEERRASEKV